MDFRYIEQSDYETLVDWWKFWKFPAPPIEMLPDSGVIVNKNGVDICAGFIYFTNSKTCWIEFIVSNPNVRQKEDRREAIISLIDILCSIGKNNGYTIAYTSLKNQSLQNKYLECGFIEGSKNCNEYIKRL
jgi:hypothetical protein